MWDVTNCCCSTGQHALITVPTKKIKIIKKRVSRTQKKVKPRPSPQPGLNLRSYTRTVQSRQPSIMNGPDGSVHIRHTEIFAAHKSLSTGLDVNTLRCNPGLASLFPWLSSVAMRYETYQFDHLVFRFTTRQPTSIAGAVGCYFDFDVDDPPCASIIELGMQSSNKSVAAWNQMEMTVNLKNNPIPWHFTRAGVVDDDHLSNKNYDLGTFNYYNDLLALGAGSILGYWEVDYSIKLKTPQYEDPVSGKWITTAATSADWFGGGLTSTGHSIRPFHVLGTKSLVFDEPFQGVLSVYAQAPDVANVPTATLVGATGSAISSVYSCLLVNFRAINDIAIRVVRGDRLNLDVVAPTLTSITFCLAKAAYDSLVY